MATVTYGLTAVLVVAMTVVSFFTFLIPFFYQVFPSSEAPLSGPLNWSVVHATTHDASCFTQGFLFLDANTAIESCGLYKQSRIQKLDFSQHNSNPSLPPRVLQIVNLRPELFAEGVTLANGLLFMLTWRENLMLVINPTTLRIEREVYYPLEGWGIAYRESDNTFLATSGSHNIYHLSVSSDTYKVSITKAVPVVCNGQSIQNLNELELVGNDLLANIWGSEVIYRINPDTGACLSVYDLSSLPRDKGSEDVLNGIAFFPNGTDSGQKAKTLWVTGKQWHSLYRIEVVVD